MSDIKWIKVAVDMFEDSKIDFIRSLPEGDAIIVTWIQMLSIAGKSNMGGYLMVAEDIPYTEQLLSNKLRRQPVLLQFALETLTKLKMIDIEDGPYHITKWEKHQNVEGMELVRIQTNNRVKKHRVKEKKKLETLQSNANVTLQVTHGNATELELELEKENKYTTDDFEMIRVRFRELHGIIDLPMYDSPIVTRILEDGIPSSTVIGVLERKFKKSATTIKYYEAAIREAHQGVVAVRQIKKYDPELESRKEEIARNKWISEGNDPSGFVYKPASGS